MTDSEELTGEHEALTRRCFLQLGAAGAAALTTSSLWAQTGRKGQAVRQAVAKLQYLTPLKDFRLFGRGKPPPWRLPEAKRREVGLTPETWRLEVAGDPDSNAKINNPLTVKNKTALNWAGLMKLAETRAVRFLQVMCCTNFSGPLGMGLWEGVPLRDVIWLTKPTGNVRRVFYYGYHNDDPKQIFRSSLPIGRVLEDPPGEHPVILCYKLNGKPLSPRAGGPVRILVPNAYGNKSVKWLQHVFLTNDPQANDTYAGWNNDTVSAVKTCARFIHVPQKAKAAQPIAITGVAQVGISGLGKVQYWLHPADKALPEDDPYFTKGNWQDAEILAPPKDWGGDLPGRKLPPIPRQFDLKTGKPKAWPLLNTIAHWVALLTDLKPGRYDLRCRTIDANGQAQPMPRPFQKSGRNAIQRVVLNVEK
jgi:DMSO/TMAO reductase YedYZ molybdopterin-dependent catalytic subunit